MKRLLVILVLVLAVIGGVTAWKLTRQQAVPASTPTQPTPQAITSPTSTENPVTRNYDIESPASLQVVVNKKRSLPANYEPADLATGALQLRREAAAAAEQLFQAAQADGVNLKFISGYRSYTTQKALYASYVANDGQANADTYSARPGHSEHQTGLAADLGNANGQCDLEVCFGSTAGGKWLATHAHEQGFIIRYLEAKTGITGYQYEPWHIRYVGKELAAQVHADSVTLEEYFNLSAAPNY